MQTTQAKNLVLGALIADAAAMGTHWIYDQAHIRKIAPEAPEFIAPNADSYAGVPGYFAHVTRQNGQTSQYGEQVIVMLDALAAHNNTYDAQLYANQFRAHFGYGGAWVGYIDHATRDTLNNFQRIEDDALAHALAIAPELPVKFAKTLVSTILKWIHHPRPRVEEALREAHGDDITVAQRLKILDAIAAMPQRFGAVDEQMPATAKLPGLIAALGEADDATFLSAVDSAVRATSDHPNAHDLGRVSARMMQAALATNDLEAIISAGHAAGSSQAQALITEARSMTDQDNATVAKHFGMACDLTYGVPGVVHNILTAPSYVEAIRANIYAGGDTCGRSILLGSILGAVYGVGGDRGIPQDWIDKLRIDPAMLRALA